MYVIVKLRPHRDWIPDFCAMILLSVLNAASILNQLRYFPKYQSRYENWNSTRRYSNAICIPFKLRLPFSLGDQTTPTQCHLVDLIPFGRLPGCLIWEPQWTNPVRQSLVGRSGRKFFSRLWNGPGLVTTAIILCFPFRKRTLSLF